MRSRAGTWTAALLFGFTACAPDATELVSLGNEALIAGRTKQAIGHFQQAQRRGPNALASLGSGLAHERLGAYAQAKAHLEAALQGLSSDRTALVALARVDAALSDYSSSRSALRQVLQQTAGDREATLLLSALAVSAAERTEALEHLRHAMAQDPSSEALRAVARVLDREALAGVPTHARAGQLSPPEEAIGAGRVAVALGQLELGEALFSVVLQGHSDRDEARLGLAEIALQRGDRRAAREALIRVAPSPGRSVAESRLALQSERCRTAGSLAQSLLADDTLSERLRLVLIPVLGQSLMARAEVEQAASVFMQHLVAHPTDWSARLTFGEALDPDRDLRLLQELATSTSASDLPPETLGHWALVLVKARFPERVLHDTEGVDHPVVTKARFRALLDMGALSEAEKALSGSLLRFPNAGENVDAVCSLTSLIGDRATLARLASFQESHSIAVLRALGDCYVSLGHVDPAIDAYRSARRVDPGDLWSSTRLGKLYLVTGQHQLALALVDTTLARTPSEESFLLLAANVNLALGQVSRARGYLERALEYYPGSPQALALLSVVVAPSDPQRAVQLAQEAREEAPASLAIASDVGWTFHLVGQHEASLAELRRATRGGGAEVDRLYRLGIAELARQLPEGPRHLTEVMRRAPASTWAASARNALGGSAEVRGASAPLPKTSTTIRQRRRERPSHDP